METELSSSAVVQSGKVIRAVGQEWRHSLIRGWNGRVSAPRSVVLPGTEVRVDGNALRRQKC